MSDTERAPESAEQREAREREEHFAQMRAQAREQGARIRAELQAVHAGLTEGLGDNPFEADRLVARQRHEQCPWWHLHRYITNRHGATINDAEPMLSVAAFVLGVVAIALIVKQRRG